MTLASHGDSTNRPCAAGGDAAYALPVSGFGAYLKGAIQAAGFPTPTHFARAAGTDPSVVLRWLSEEQRPTIRSIERIAPILGKTINELVLAAYPDRLGSATPPPIAVAHPLVHELSRMLADDSPIPAADRQALETVLDRMLDPYRTVMRRRRSA
jgi:transcriptional regulator with XRE-family HTH domain